MEKSLAVAVVQGGPSSEAEVSRVSAAGVAAALTAAGHRVVRLECDRTLPRALAEAALDVVFPVVHGAFGEDGCLQGLLELLALPYVGAGVLASAWANDKVAAKVAYRAAGLPVAPDAIVRRVDGPTSQLAAHVYAAVGRALVVKPATQGSGLGVALLPSLRGPDDPALLAALDAAFALDAVVVVEAFIQGLEVTCGVLDLHGQSPRALPPTEIRAKRADWYDFQSRYGQGGSEHLCPAPFPAAVIAEIQRVALLAHRALQCRDLSRSDFVVSPEQGRVVLLETNTMPGMTPTSLYPEEATVAGVPFDRLCDSFVRSAVARGVRKTNRAEPFPT